MPSAISPVIWIIFLSGGRIWLLAFWGGGEMEKKQCSVNHNTGYRAQVALEISTGHQLHDHQGRLSLRDHAQQPHLHQSQHSTGLVWEKTFIGSGSKLNSFMTEASFRNSMRSLMLAVSLTVLMATRVSGSSLITPLARPSYTMPKEP
ncbi:hypothetical protein EYF80_039126 [Liparis tanakae]|uniref:Uncharacterized protein n=1 Tax=Liparis tanakae TaxID=230148 RepID=A0A4Z2GAN9_9TELE|nr:hypothetical protein EYF80_039126 [Liparis tanakae]